MPLRVTLVVVCGVAAIVHAVGYARDDGTTTYVAGAVAYAALAALVVVARGPVALLAGMAVLALSFAAIAVIAPFDPPGPGGYFLYQPLAGLTPGQVGETVVYQLTRETVPLIAYAAVAVAVARLPVRRRPVLLFSGIVVVLALGVWMAVSVTGRRGGEYALTAVEALALIGGPMVLMLLVLGATILATQRVQPFLVAGGLALTALAALSALDPTQFTTLAYGEAYWPQTPIETAVHWLRGGIVMRPYYDFAEWLFPVLAFIQIAGAALITVGVLRAGREPEAVT